MTSLLICLIGLGPRSPAQNAPRYRVSMNQGWQFCRLPERDLVGPDKKAPERLTLSSKQLASIADAELMSGDLRWSSATLPNTAHLEAANVDRPWQGVCYYRKVWAVPLAWKGKSVSMTFEGAMQASSVWVNGRLVGGRRGGYLPVVIDISKDLDFGGKNRITVRLDNRDNPLFPPGKPTPDLDFLYWGGLYRDAFLEVANPVHITDPFLSHTPRGAGVVSSCESATKSFAAVETKTEVANDSDQPRRVRVVQIAGTVRNRSSWALVPPHSKRTFIVDLGFHHPNLWSPKSPSLYSLKTQVWGARLLDQEVHEIGLRRLEFSRTRGLLVNGRPTRLIGTNRHQEYPYIGNALSDNASYRDVKQIKDAGFNCIRLSHYPQDPAVMDACDHLGLFVFPCTAGWQFYNPDPRFESAVESDIHDLVRWHRLHPSVLAWEASLNETYPKKAIAQKWYAAAHSEFTQSDMACVGDYAYGFSWDWPYNQWDDAKKTRPQDVAGKPGYIREYGDWEFGGAASTSRKSRSDGWPGDLQEAWNFVWSHNRDRSQWPWTMGDGTWVMFDYHRGYDPTTEHSGMADQFRIPRIITAFFQSQYVQKPMVRIASDWSPKPNVTKVVVFSNGDRVRLYLNGRLVGDQTPDVGPDTAYGDYDHGGTPWDGGNAKHLVHPPFTFHVHYRPGTLKAVALKANKVIARDSIQTPGSPARLKLEVNLRGRPLAADGADSVFVYVSLDDLNGTLVGRNGAPIRILVSGPARVIGRAVQQTENGVAPFLIQSTGRPGEIRITAMSGSLKGATRLFAR